MLTRIRWRIANWIAPGMAPAAPELRDCLHQIYNWTPYKHTPWAIRTRRALIASGVKVSR